MDKIKSLEFFSNKIVKIYFSGNKSRAFSYKFEEKLGEDIREIIETSGSFYYRNRINGDKVHWIDEASKRIPTSIEQKLNQIVIKLLKSNKN